VTTKVEKSILVNVPVGTAYNQWTQFEDFPQFMGGVKSVTQVDDSTVHWVAEIGGVKREWDATILEQVPDTKVAWAATSGATNAGSVTFEPVSTEQTSVTLSLEYEPEGLVETIGDKLNFIERQATSDLDKFKEFIESERYATGAWRGSVNPGSGVGTPGVEAAAASQGDSGKAGLSAKTVLGTAAVAAAGVAAVAAARKSDDSTDDQVDGPSDVDFQPVDLQPVDMQPVDVQPVVVEPVIEEIDVVVVETDYVSDTDGGVSR
jgi:carbon monoxide dehydrogenase subunit G